MFPAVPKGDVNAMLDHGFNESCVVDNVEGCVDVCPCCDHEREVNKLLTQMRVSLQYLHASMKVATHCQTTTLAFQVCPEYEEFSLHDYPLILGVADHRPLKSSISCKEYHESCKIE